VQATATDCKKARLAEIPTVPVFVAATTFPARRAVATALADVATTFFATLFAAPIVLLQVDATFFAIDRVKETVPALVALIFFPALLANVIADVHATVTP
jgi:hypothetical protein